jgi:hypothetical protein
MIGDIVAKMTSGIDMTQIVLVFITKRCVEKVGGTNSNDNCQIEFDYAFIRKTREMMLPIVMEGQMRDTSQWALKIGKNRAKPFIYLFIYLFI